ncbi:hypothetical protein FA95DRAFT_1557916, partial [Auriscalpium vulgare]
IVGFDQPNWFSICAEHNAHPNWSSHSPTRPSQSFGAPGWGCIGASPVSKPEETSSGRTVHEEGIPQGQRDTSTTPPPDERHGRTEGVRRSDGTIPKAGISALQRVNSYSTAAT